MEAMTYPVLRGSTLFRKNEQVYINRSNELEQYCNVIHRHDFIEICYVYSGSGIHIVGETQYEITKGDLFIINYDVPHGFFRHPNGGANPVVYNCNFMPGFLDASLFSSIHFQDITSSFLFQSLFPDEYSPLPDLTLRGAAYNEIGDLFGRMYTEYKSMEKGYMDIIRAYLIELLVKVFRYMDHSTRRQPPSRSRELVEKAISYMKSNYNSELKLEDLAMKSFISKNYFSKLFKEVTGTNFSDYVQNLRIDEACTLLKNTDMKITDIAFHTGFKDIKFFYDVFKKITGLTPGDYRKSS